MNNENPLKITRFGFKTISVSIDDMPSFYKCFIYFHML